MQTTAAERTKRSSKRTLVEKILDEVISLGGIPCTRATAYAVLKRRGHERRTCDLFAFMPAAITAEPLDVDAVLAIVGEG